MCPQQNPSASPPWSTTTSSNSHQCLAISLHGPHRGVTKFKWLRCNLRLCRSAHQDGTLHCDKFECYRGTSSVTLCPTSLSITWITCGYRIRPWEAIYISFHLLPPGT